MIDDYNMRTAYQEAIDRVMYLQEKNSSQQVLQSAQEMVNALSPDGFVERHITDCTKIVANRLQGKDPFEDFSPF